MKNRIIISRDILAVLFLILTFTACVMFRDSPLTVFELSHLLQYALTYSVFRLLFASRHGRQAEKFLAAVAAAVCLWLSLVGFNQLTGSCMSGHGLYVCTGPFKNPGPYGGFLAVMLSVVAAWQVKGRAQQAFKLAALFMGIPVMLATLSRAGILSLGLALATLAFVRHGLKEELHSHPLAASALMILLSVTSAVAYMTKKDSADSRMLMNRIALTAIAESPIHGTGPGMFLKTYGEAQLHYFKQENASEKERLLADVPEFPFNTYLSVGVEYGIPAMLLFTLFIISCIIHSIRSGSLLAYGIIALSVFACFSYPQELTAFRIIWPILAAAGFNEKSNHTQVMKNKVYKAGVMIACTSIAMMIPALLTASVHLNPSRQAERKWRDKEPLYQNGCYARVVTEYGELEKRMRHNYTFLFEYGHSLLECGEYEEASAVLKRGMRISADPMFWNLAGMAAQSLGHMDEAERDFIHAYEMVPNRMYPLYLLALSYFERGDTVNARMTARRIEYFTPKVESDATQGMRDEIRQLIRNQSPSKSMPEVCQNRQNRTSED